MSTDKIKFIETAPLRLSDRVLVMLTYIGEKPATYIEFAQGCVYNHETGIYELGSLETVARNTLNFLFDTIELPHSVGKKFLQNCGSHYTGTTCEGKSECLPVYVGKNQASYDALIQASRESGKFNARNFGLALGFPETAVRGYLGEIPRMEASETNKRVPRYMRSFTGFIFSRDNFEEELKTSQRWHDALKEASPTLYELTC